MWVSSSWQLLSWRWGEQRIQLCIGLAENSMLLSSGFSDTSGTAFTRLTFIPTKPVTHENAESHVRRSSLAVTSTLLRCLFFNFIYFKFISFSKERTEGVWTKPLSSLPSFLSLHDAQYSFEWGSGISLQGFCRLCSTASESCSKNSQENVSLAKVIGWLTTELQDSRYTPDINYLFELFKRHVLVLYIYIYT